MTENGVLGAVMPVMVAVSAALAVFNISARSASTRVATGTVFSTSYFIFIGCPFERCFKQGRFHVERLGRVSKMRELANNFVTIIRDKATNQLSLARTTMR